MFQGAPKLSLKPIMSINHGEILSFALVVGAESSVTLEVCRRHRCPTRSNRNSQWSGSEPRELTDRGEGLKG